MFDEKKIKLIEMILAKGDRVELIPIKNGVRIIHIKRKEVKPEKYNELNNIPTCKSSGGRAESG